MIDTRREKLPGPRPSDAVSRVDLADEEAIRESERAICIAEIEANYERGAFGRLTWGNFNRGMRYAVKCLRGMA